MFDNQGDRQDQGVSLLRTDWDGCGRRLMVKRTCLRLLTRMRDGTASGPIIALVVVMVDGV
jgi:hypothetical protein